MYIKTANGKKIDVVNVDFCCKCPICGREVFVQDFFEFCTDENFDPYDGAVYCDDCSRDCEVMRGLLRPHIPPKELDKAVKIALKAMHSGVTA